MAVGSGRGIIFGVLPTPNPAAAMSLVFAPPAPVTVPVAGARVEMQELFTVLNVVRVGQVHFFYRARMLDTTLDPGPETIEARLFREDEVPWDELAFRTVRQTLEYFFADRRSGHYGVHAGDIA